MASRKLQLALEAMQMNETAKVEALLHGFIVESARRILEELDEKDAEKDAEVTDDIRADFEDELNLDAEETLEDSLEDEDEVEDEELEDRVMNLEDEIEQLKAEFEELLAVEEEEHADLDTTGEPENEPDEFDLDSEIEDEEKIAESVATLRKAPAGADKQQGRTVGNGKSVKVSSKAPVPVNGGANTGVAGEPVAFRGKTVEKKVAAPEAKNYVGQDSDRSFKKPAKPAKTKADAPTAKSVVGSKDLRP